MQRTNVRARAARLGALATLLWPVAGYPLVLALLARRRSASSPASSASARNVAVIVPTYNEAGTIERRLRNLVSCVYSRGDLRVLVVDSGSADGTAEIADRFAAEHTLDVTVVREGERRGKASAINHALGVIDRDAIAIVTDSPTEFDRDAIERVAAAFDDPNVGAATGTFVVTGEDGWVQRAEASFWRVRNELRAREAALDSTPFLSGELCAFRRSLVAALDEDTLADDMNIALQVRRAGYRTVTVECATFHEQRSNDLRELMETKTRRAAGGIQELLRFRDMIFARRYGSFGMLILPSAMLYYLPLRIPAALVVAPSALRALRRAPTLLSIAALMGGSAIALRARERIAMLALTEWLMIRGWQRYLTGQMDVRWRQERRTPSETAEVTRAR
jgi:cellulose synthase/poly-beta-1,6-N-acetylglucosamine synthase-like glycosyltransferase